MNNEILALIAVLIISAISMVGVVTISLKKSVLKRIVFILISLAAGTLIGDVFLHLIPQIYDGHSQLPLPLFILLGILGFFVLEKVLHWQHHHHIHNEEDKETTNHVHPIGISNLVADGIHNFVDGAIIGASFAAGIEVGVATTIAVALHEIPQEMADFGVLIHAGFSRAKALIYNLLSALMSVVGLIVAIVLGGSNQDFLTVMLAIAAGGFIYIALADLVPELKAETNWRRSALQLLFVVIGIGFMLALSIAEGEEHNHGVPDNHQHIHSDEEYHHENDHEGEADHHEQESGENRLESNKGATN